MKPTIIKRDGGKVPFDIRRIKDAILAAAETVADMDADYAETVAAKVLEQFEDRQKVEIHEIQDAVEDHLMAGPYKAVARAYIEYRHDRDRVREEKSRLSNEIRGLVEQTNSDILNENANKDSKVIPTSATCWQVLLPSTMRRSTCCHAELSMPMSRVTFTTTILIILRSSRCSTVC